MKFCDFQSKSIISVNTFLVPTHIISHSHLRYRFPLEVLFLLFFIRVIIQSHVILSTISSRFEHFPMMLRRGKQCVNTHSPTKKFESFPYLDFTPFECRYVIFCMSPFLTFSQLFNKLCVHEACVK